MLIVNAVCIITALVILATSIGIAIGHHTRNDELSSPIGLISLVLISGICLSLLAREALIDYQIHLNTTAVVIGTVLTIITLVTSSMTSYVQLHRSPHIVAH